MRKVRTYTLEVWKVNKHTSFEVNGGIVSLGDGGDHEWLIPLSSVVSVQVDWTKASGAVALLMRDGFRAEVVFEEGDGGMECADAISGIFAAWRGVEQVTA